jgi:hypothetical protein
MPPGQADAIGNNVFRVHVLVMILRFVTRRQGDGGEQRQVPEPAQLAETIEVLWRCCGGVVPNLPQ